MLEDRDYMRQPAYNEPSFSSWLKLPNWNWSWTLVIVVINVVVFLVECAFAPTSFMKSMDVLDVPFCNQYFALSLDGIKHGYLWQLVTYQFMHGGFFHIFLNCWMIIVFGRILEDLLGGRTFLLILLSGGVVGGLFQMLAAALWPEWFDGPVIGASAGAFGLVAAFATLFPERELFLLLFFFIPLRLKAKVLLIGSAIFAVWGMIFPDKWYGGSLLGAHVANAAHLGGMFAGWIFVLAFVKGSWFHGKIGGALNPRPPVIPSATPPVFWRGKTARPETELTPEELLRTQVDPILDKISAHGLQSLNQREREILEKASGKLAKR